MSVNLIATATFPYAGRSLKPGDLFEAVSERDAETLRLLDKAEDAPSIREYIDRSFSAEVPPGPVTLSDGGTYSAKPKRQYRRRDLVPEQ